MASLSRSALIVATGSGVPMRSERPKPLHVLCGRPMLSYVLDALAGAGVSRAAVVTGGDPRVRKRIEDDPPRLALQFVAQPESVRMPAAALTGLSAFEDVDDDDILVVPADIPLVRSSTIDAVFNHHVGTDAAMSVLIEDVDPAHPGGRLTRDRHGRIDGSTAEPVGDLTEKPLGMWCVRQSLLAPALRRLARSDLRGRSGLDGVVDVLADSGHTVEAVPADDPHEMLEVVSRTTLAEAEAAMRARTNAEWLDRGVTMVDPSRTYIDTTVMLGTDVTVFPGTILRGETVIGDGCELGPDTTIDRGRVGARAVVEKTVARGAVIGEDARVGPFAVLEAGSTIPDGMITGPFYATPGSPR